jgi:hypothetical protein
MMLGLVSVSGSSLGKFFGVAVDNVFQVFSAVSTTFGINEGNHYALLNCIYDMLDSVTRNRLWLCPNPALPKHTTNDGTKGSAIYYARGIELVESPDCDSWNSIIQLCTSDKEKMHSLLSEGRDNQPCIDQSSNTDTLECLRALYFLLETQTEESSCVYCYNFDLAFIPDTYPDAVEDVSVVNSQKVSLPYFSQMNNDSLLYVDVEDLSDESEDEYEAYFGDIDLDDITKAMDSMAVSKTGGEGTELLNALLEGLTSQESVEEDDSLDSLLEGLTLHDFELDEDF